MHSASVPSVLLNFDIAIFSVDHCMFTNCPFYGSCSVDDEGSTKCSCPGAYSCPPGIVCGSDGLDYGNECKMKTKSCKERKELVVVNKGACSKFISKNWFVRWL